jgi:hypothetical protein
VFVFLRSLSAPGEKLDPNWLTQRDWLAQAAGQ